MDQLVLSQRDLFFALDREFQRLRSPECYRCRTPLPVRRATPAPAASNWEVENPEACTKHCNLVLASVVERMQATHALAANAPEVSPG